MRWLPWTFDTRLCSLSYCHQLHTRKLPPHASFSALTGIGPNLFDWEVRKQAARVSGDAKLIAGNSDLREWPPPPLEQHEVSR